MSKQSPKRKKYTKFTFELLYSRGNYRAEPLPSLPQQWAQSEAQHMGRVFQLQ